MNIRPTRKWWNKAEKYKKKAISFWNEANLARHSSHGEEIKECPYDFSEKSALELFLFESKGLGSIEIDTFSSTLNGYAIGKKWIDVEINRSKEGFEK